MDLINEIIDWFKRLFQSLEAHTLGTQDQVKDAITKGIIVPLKLPQAALAALMAQSDVETGHWNSLTFINTHSLFNRHQGSSRGEWTGMTYWASDADPDVRIYTDIYQSARDMAQLLTDPLYKDAVLALHNGDAEAYAYALQGAGFAAAQNYAQAILDRTQFYA